MKMSDNKQALQVAALKNGTVIDHIPSDKLFTVVALLGLQDSDSNITIGNNFESKKLGKKGIIKVADRFFTDVYILRNKMLEHTRPNLRILHPLPRVNEIAYDVDENPKAYYFQQAQNGLYARQAILCDVLGITLNDVIEDAKK